MDVRLARCRVRCLVWFYEASQIVAKVSWSAIRGAARRIIGVSGWAATGVRCPREGSQILNPFNRSSVLYLKLALCSFETTL
jgi:hypothetical protein